MNCLAGVSPVGLKAHFAKRCAAPECQPESMRLRHVQVLTILSCGLVLNSCADRALGIDHGPIVLSLVPNEDSVIVGVAGAHVRPQIQLDAKFADGISVSGAYVQFVAIGHNASANPITAKTDADGRFQVDWRLGDIASDTQYLVANVRLGGKSAEYRLRAHAKPAALDSLILQRDTLVVRLGVPTPVALIGMDQYGNVIDSVSATLAPADTSVVTVGPNGEIVGHRRGVSHVAVAAGKAADSLIVKVVQVVSAIRISVDSVHFDALGDVQQLTANLIDDSGLQIVDSVPVMDLSSASMLSREPGDLRFRSIGNGAGQILLKAGAITKSVPVEVRQQPTKVSITSSTAGDVQLARLNDAVGIHCDAVDRNGFAVPANLVPLDSKHGLVAASDCSQMIAAKSGVDTVRWSGHGDSASVEVALAVRAVPVNPRGVSLLANIPSDQNNQQWAPTAMIAPNGSTELYYAAYVGSPGDTLPRADLHRLISTDGGQTFVSDGIAMAHDSASCDPDGWGIEDIAIAERADAPGYRLFYSSGSTCLGWRVRSAVSADRRTWVKEDGNRIGDPTAAVAYSSGEGMTVMRHPQDGWRMWVGTFIPNEGFAIEDWHSPDQINWTRHAVIFSPASFPTGPMYSVYSPSVVQIGPSMWRMYFCADNRNQPNGRSRLYSAVSRDLENWRFEGEFLSQPDLSFWYATVAGDELYFIRETSDSLMFLGRTQIVQP